MRTLLAAVGWSLAATLAAAGTAGAAPSPPGVSRLVLGVASEAVDVVPLADGGSLVVSDVNPGVAAGTVTVTRLSPDGFVNPRFGSGGSVAARFPQTPNGPRVLAGLDAAGRLTLATQAGSVPSTPALGTGLVRLLFDGTPDPTFGQGGAVIDPEVMARSLAVAPDGTVTLAGNSSAGDSAALVTRHLASGSLDPAFGSGGRLRIVQAADGTFTTGAPAPGRQSASGAGIVLAPDGETDLLINGVGPPAPGAAFADDPLHDKVGVVALDPSGQLDPRFGDRGGVLLDDAPVTPAHVPTPIGVSLQPLPGGVGVAVGCGCTFGSVLVSSIDRAGDVRVLGPARDLPAFPVGIAGSRPAILFDGDLGAGPPLPGLFGVLAAGRVRPLIGELLRGNAAAIAADARGRFLVAATGPDGNGEVVRYLGDGRIDRTFAACIVPRLAGMTVARARVVLAAAHCRLGSVGRGRSQARRARRRAPALVGRQLPAPGSHQPVGTPVALST